MAYIRYFDYTRHSMPSVLQDFSEDEIKPERHVGRVPRIFWGDGAEWLEASLFLAARADNIPEGQGSVESLRSRATHLKAYADFIEANEDLSWDEFGARKRGRPTYRFRGHLILQRDEERQISPSTASNRITAVKAFYQWVVHVNLLNPSYQAFVPVLRKISMTRWYGMNDSITVHSSDLAIPNKTITDGLEDGLIPLSREDRDKALRIVRERCTQEFALALELGFHSGLRIGSIIDLKTSTIEGTTPSKSIKGWCDMPIGPYYGVRTKGSVNYSATISPSTMTRLRDYAISSQRLLRAAKAKDSDRHLLFLTRRGQQFTTTSWQGQMRTLREAAEAQGLDLRKFYFHCTRATFGTVFAEFMLSLPKVNTRRVLSILKRMMGHKDESTTLRYIRWVEDRELVNQLNDEYGAQLLEPST